MSSRAVLSFDAAVAMTEPGSVNRRWLEARAKLGDPGPVFVEDDVMFTEQSEKEDAGL
jgi:hypothetical protein